MAALVVPLYRRPPFIYRLARLLRWVGVFVLVALVIFAGTVAYSAYEVAHASIQSKSFTGVFVSNGMIELSGSFTLTNPGIYPIEGLVFAAHIANDSGVHLTTINVGPETVEGHSSGLFPIVAWLPISASSAAESLLFVDQYLKVNAWANVTYAYMFPLSVALSETRSWGAPFAGFHATVGTPTYSNGNVSAPVTVSFANHASFVEQGSLSFVLESPASVACGGGSFSLDVNPGSLYDQTQYVTLNTGCNPSGGLLEVTLTFEGSTTSLPPEPIP